MFGQVGVSTASRMVFVTDSGRVISDRCPALTVEMWAPARCDIVSCSAGGMTLSWVPISDQDGIVCQAGGPEGSKSWLRAAGRWVAASKAGGGGVAPVGENWSKPRWGGVGSVRG